MIIDLIRNYKFLNIITVIFVVILLLSNLIASIKITQIDLPFIGKVSFAAGLLFFPISYLVGDLLTEVYGYAKSRQVIWTGFISLIVSNILIKILVSLPPDPNWNLQSSYEAIFAMSFRVSIASMLAFFCGEFCNSYVVAKLKVLCEGKFTALRIIGSTVAGELVDTLIFYPLAFWGDPNFPPDLIFRIMIMNYLVKVIWEVIAYPGTKQLIKFLKRSENEDYYDRHTDFSPFHLSEDNSTQLPNNQRT
ncbi:MAG: VUT family protein [Proteobacteria bacterium]|nr:VUT family protein [Pseudomonadota bacterium]